MIDRENHDFPFYDRPDLTPFLVHLTKNSEDENGRSAYKNLVNILQTGKILGSGTKKGFIKGPNRAACFMDIPFAALKHVLNEENADPENPRYEPYGVVVTKKNAYRKGCRPVLYLSNAELERIEIPEQELWRVVRLEGVEERDVNWLHEREWRAKTDFKLPPNAFAALVSSPAEARKLTRHIQRYTDKFQVKPASIIPLKVLCQGLPYA
ncbi:MAG: hypothetical protein OXC18_01185 [Desulfurellaceae bacterium]|nr:hypothetical protein [Desulfurellaceae bacterium]